MTELAGFFAYDPAFPGGVFVACGDVTGDGVAEVITGAGPGGGPHVRFWSYTNGQFVEIFGHGFFAYDPDFAGGVNVAVGDVNGDGVADIVTGAGPGGGPHVRVFNFLDGRFTELGGHGFFAYDPAFAGGVNVAVGDVDGDGVAEIVTGAGPGGGPHVRVWSLVGDAFVERAASFFAYDPAFPGGVNVAVGDVTGDGMAEIVTGAGPGGGPHVRVFSLAGGAVTEVAGFFAYDPAFPGGVHVAAADLGGDGVAEIITGAGPGDRPHVRAFSLAGGVVTEVASFFAYDPAFPGGVFVAAVDRTRIVPAVRPGFRSRLTPAILSPAEPPDDAGVQHGAVAADEAPKTVRADAQADDLFLPRRDVGAGADVERVAIGANETTMIRLVRPPVARDVPVSAGLAPSARAGWPQSTVEPRRYQARRARAPPDVLGAGHRRGAPGRA